MNLVLPFEEQCYVSPQVVGPKYLLNSEIIIAAFFFAKIGYIRVFENDVHGNTKIISILQKTHFKRL